MSFTIEIEAKLRAAGIAVEEFGNGYRATDSAVVASRLAFFYGLRMLPIRKKTKIPCIRGWSLNASNQIGSIFQWRADFCSDFSVLTGIASGIWALDVDGPRGAADLVRLCNELGELPPTVKVISGRSSGGFHLWFQASPTGEDLRTVSKVLSSNIDVRGWGGQILLPGSAHRSGTRYQFAPDCAPDQIGLASLPQGWLDALPKRRPAGTPVPRSASRNPPPRSRISNEKSIAIGDGDGRGGFHGPIYAQAIRFIRAAPDVDAKALATVLKAKILNAPVDPARDKADLERYASDSYLLDQIEKARAWVLSERF